MGKSTDIKGKYVASVEVTENVVTVTFGQNANSAIATENTLTFTAGLSANGDVSWQCGSKPMAAEITKGTKDFAASGAGGKLAQKYRPAECRG